MVIADEQLTFQLTVTDDQGATDSDSVNVTVQNIAGPDTTPPVTTFSTQRQMVQGKPKHTVTLTVNESATTYFRFNGQGTITAGGADTTAWQTYTVPVVVQLVKKGSGDFEFYSEDTAANVEATQLEVLQ